MNQKNKVIEVYGLWFADLIGIVISFILSTYIRFGNFRDMGDQEIHFQVCLIFVLFSTIYTFFIDWNRNILKRTFSQEIWAVLKYNTIMVVVVEFLMFFLKWSDVFSRLVMGYFFLINLALTLVIHLLGKKGLITVFSAESSRIKVMVVTQKELLSETIEKLSKNLELNYQIVAAACIDADMAGQEILGIPIVATRDNLVEVATQMPLDEAFIYTPMVTQNEAVKYVSPFDEMGVICHYCVELPNAGNELCKAENFADYAVLTYTRFQSSYKRLLIKRVIDIVGSVVGLIITLVLFPFVAIAIKLDSKGPIFFSQIRIGRNGRRFKIYKYRSMYADAEQRKKELEQSNEMKGLMFKMENDPRITKVGAFLRKTSIDELPQFYNVLRGDMSLVGTRPPTEDEFEQYNQYYRRRISMTPGLTGLWQVSGRSEVDDFDSVVAFDLKYIDSWSLKLDFKILLQTVGVVIFGKGAK